MLLASTTCFFLTNLVDAGSVALGLAIAARSRYVGAHVFDRAAADSPRPATVVASEITTPAPLPCVTVLSHSAIIGLESMRGCDNVKGGAVGWYQSVSVEINRHTIGHSTTEKYNCTTEGTVTKQGSARHCEASSTSENHS